MKEKQRKVGIATITLLGVYLATMSKYVVPFLLIGIALYLLMEYLIVKKSWED